MVLANPTCLSSCMPSEPKFKKAAFSMPHCLIASMLCNVCLSCFP